MTSTGQSDSVRTESPQPYTVFDISGNRHRFVALVDYGLQTVSVEHVLTYEEYDEQRWKAR